MPTITVYIVHSDNNENNILQDFDNLKDAVEYAQRNIEYLTFIEEVVMDSESEEVHSSDTIWAYDEEDYFGDDDDDELPF